MKSITLDKAYKYEYDADVKERILLIRRVLTDKQHIETVAQELHKSRAWAYKWYKRYNDKGIEGLKDKPRSGRPSLVKHDLMIKIRKEMEDRILDGISGRSWILFKREQVSNITKYISIDYCTTGAFLQRYLRRDS